MLTIVNNLRMMPRIFGLANEGDSHSIIQFSETMRKERALLVI